MTIITGDNFVFSNTILLNNYINIPNTQSINIIFSETPPKLIEISGSFVI